MTRRMWQLYAAAWLPFILVLVLATQAEAVMKGHFDPMLALQTALGMIPAVLVHVLVWPFSGYLERSALRAGAVIAVHVVASVLFTITWMGIVYGVLSLLHAPDMSSKAPSYAVIWPFLFYMMMYGVIAGIFHAVRASAKAREHAIATLQAQSLLVASELAALRNKLNPHFLFNTLHSIIALTRKQPAAAEAALFKFSDMLRYVLDTEKSGNDRVTLDDELRFVRDYLDLEALRLGARLTVEWDVDDSATGYCLPALSVQPLVENSIKHAFNPRSQPGRLTIRTRIDALANILWVSVRDDGPGADPAMVRQTTGLGVRTVERRLALEYGSRATFDIDTAPGEGFQVTLTIPLDGIAA
ncbi:MAG: histidine kinase [Pseudomonadota bacterium]